MARLLIRFHDSTLESFDWTTVEDDGRLGQDWQPAAQPQLGGLLSRHAMPVVLVIPQQLVYLTEFDLPEKGGHQILSSIEYQIEDQLAQETEKQHFATGTPLGNSVPIAVVGLELMQACQALQEQYAMRVVRVIPEVYLCPRHSKAGGVDILESHDGLLLRYGEHKGLKCRKDLLDSMLSMIDGETPVTQVNCHARGGAESPGLESARYDLQFVSSNGYGVVELGSTKVIDLLQRQFQATSHWERLARAWKGIAAIIVITLGVSIYGQVLALQAMENELAAVKKDQYELVKPFLDPGLTPDSNLKKAVIRLLQKQESAQSESDFLDLLALFSRSKSAYAAIQVEKIGYQQQRLSVDFRSAKLDEVEAFHAVLNTSAISTKLERLNIKPESISGQFILGGE